MKDVSTMTDAELSALIGQSDLVAAARAEVERRRIENDPNIIARRPSEPCNKATTTANCPNCGRNDAIATTKTMYEKPQLAYGGEPVGTAALCKCGVWYNAQSGKYECPNTTFYCY